MVEVTKYEKYKPSGIEVFGDIPNGWELKRLKHFATVVLGKMLQNDDSGLDNLKPYLRSFNVQWERIDTSEIKEMWLSEDEMKQYRLQKFDLVVSEGGEVGRAAIWNEEIEECYIQNSVHKVTCNSKANPLYILHVFTTLGRSGFFDMIINKVSIGHLTREKLVSVKFPIPSFEEQLEIAQYLRSETQKIDTLIANKKAQVEKLKELRQIEINNAVTKGLDKNVELKDSGIDWLGKVNKLYRVSSFKRVCKLKQGLQIDFELRFFENSPNRLPYITIKAINAGDENESMEYIEDADPGVICYPDDVLLARTGATGEVVTNLHGVFHNNFFKILYDRHQIDRDFLVFYLKNSAIKSYLHLLAGTTTIPDLNHRAFFSAPIVLPSIEEQKKIVRELNHRIYSFNELIANTEQQIEKLTELRKIRIYEAVTGKIKVPAYEQAIA